MKRYDPPKINLFDISETDIMTGSPLQQPFEDDKITWYLESSD